MNRKTAMKLFGLLGLLMLLSCGYADRHRNNSSCEQVLVDSLEVRVQDSLFSNVHYSRSQVLDALTQTQDSQVYYRLLALYGKTFFVSSDFDSILYYNRRVKEFSRNASQSLQSPQWNDVLSDVYNIEGNVWMQLNRPDSAITDYKKAYEYRLRGKKLHLLPDIADIFHTIVGCRIDLDHVHRCTRCDRLAHCALPARTSVYRMFAVDCFRKYFCNRRLTGSSCPAEQICMSDTVCIDLVLKRPDDRILSFYIFEFIRTEFTV